MNPFKQRNIEAGRLGFSLIEVIIAIGLVAGSILAIIAFLGATGQATADVINSSVASRIADNIRAELETTDIDFLATATGANLNPPLTLFATKDGERVRLSGPNATGGPVANDPVTGDPPGIAEHNLYFKIEIRQLQNSLEIPDASESAMLPLSIHVIWPHHLPMGPEIPGGPVPDYTQVTSERQSRYVFNTTILRKR